jgi:hypothetical protein
MLLFLVEGSNFRAGKALVGTMDLQVPGFSSDVHAMLHYCAWTLSPQ